MLKTQWSLIVVLWAFKIPKSLFVHVEICPLFGYCSFAVLVALAILIAAIAEKPYW